MQTPETSDPTPATAAARRPRWSVTPIGVAVTAALVLSLWNVFDSRRELGKMREEVARRLQTVELEGRESRTIARDAQEVVREIQGKTGVLEAKIAESQSQQVALEQLYQELSRGRDDWMLAEIEQTIAIASQQLQLAGNVPGALLALQTADSRLARSDRPQYIPLRRVIGKDIERLKALPALDLPGLTLKLDQVIAQADALPLLADGRPAPATNVAEPDESAWSRAVGLVWGEMRQLFRIQRLDNSDQGLLTPEQSYFLRENLKLRLLNARIALLQRNEGLFRSDLRTATGWLKRYFDGRERSVGAAVTALEQLNAAAVAVELPTLADSLAAVRGFKASADKPRQ
jgi:uncharacterized protein HemX